MNEDLQRDLDLIREALETGATWIDMDHPEFQAHQEQIDTARAVVLPRIERAIEALGEAGDTP